MALRNGIAPVGDDRGVRQVDVAEFLQYKEGLENRLEHILNEVTTKFGEADIVSFPAKICDASDPRDLELLRATPLAFRMRDTDNGGTPARYEGMGPRAVAPVGLVTSLPVTYSS